MEFFTKASAVKLRSHLDKYLVADLDREKVRQSRNGSSGKSIWIVELVEGKSHLVRLKGCHGRYLTATEDPFLLGMTGERVVQGDFETDSDWKFEWEPIRDGFQVRLKSWCGKYLRGNGGTPPWRNSVTHDEPHGYSATRNWVLWDVEAVGSPEAPLDDSFAESVMSSSVSDENFGSDPSSPMSVFSLSSSPRRNSKLQVDGEIIFVEYEGLPMICFNCGRYGHLQDTCPEKMNSSGGGAPNAATPAAREPMMAKQPLQERESKNFGDWMLVQRRPRRTTDKTNKENALLQGRNLASTSRYEVLNMVDPQGEEMQEVYVPDREFSNQKTVGNYQKKKGKETKVNSETPLVNNHVTTPQNKSNDGVLTKQFVVKHSETSLDPNYHSAVRVEDPRLPQTSRVNKGNKAGPVSNQPNNGNDPHSKARGVKLSSRVHIHALGAKPSSDGSGPSIKAMKDLARGIHCDMGLTDAAILEEEDFWDQG